MNTTPAPLTPIVLEILLSLIDAPRHGYDVMQQVHERTGGRIRLLPGTLYRALHRLVDDGWIQEVDAPPGSGSDDPRRLYHGLTRAGREAVRAEVERLEATLSYARSKDLRRSHGGS